MPGAPYVQLGERLDDGRWSLVGQSEEDDVQVKGDRDAGQEHEGDDQERKDEPEASTAEPAPPRRPLKGRLDTLGAADRLEQRARASARSARSAPGWPARAPVAPPVGQPSRPQLLGRQAQTLAQCTPEPVDPRTHGAERNRKSFGNFSVRQANACEQQE